MIKLPPNLHFQTKLPEEIKGVFYTELHLDNLKRIYIFCLALGLISCSLLVFDYMRIQSGEYYQNNIYKYLLYLHLSGLFYFLWAGFIKLKEKHFYSGKYDPKYFVYFVIVFIALNGIPQDITSFARGEGEIIMYIVLIVLINWLLNLTHPFRVVFTTMSFMVFVLAILMVGQQSTIQLINNLYEIIGFTVVPLIFGTVDFNFRVSKFLNEKLLEREKKKMEELEKFKSSLYTNLTHEFRTPLTLIMGMTDLCREYVNLPNKEKLIEALDSIDQNSSNLLKLINQMLDLAKLESGGMELHLEQKDIIAFSKALIATLHSFAEKKNIDLKFQSALESFYLDFDEEKMHTIISNLLSNALKFTPEDGEISLETTAIREGNEESLIISVRDSGYGIGKEHLPHIFDRFYQAETGPTRKTTGTGIGLALTRELVELMHGDLTVESELGKGALFTLRFSVSRNTPRSELEYAFIEPLKKPVKINQSPLKKDRKEMPLVLIVDDHAEILSYLSTLLEQDYVVETANDGVKGVEKAKSLIPDVIISDVMMPEKDGYTLCKELKQEEKTSHIPIILLTARAEITDRLEGLETGADAYLSKPFKKEELFIRLQKLIELRSALQKKYSSFVLIDKPDELRKENNFIHKVNTLLEENLDNPSFSVAELARGVFMSRMQLHRKLKAVSNRSAANYIRSYRLYKAQPMLKDASRKIGDVAFEVGFHDPNYFSKVFQKEFGITPSEYRTIN